ncbi:MAG: YdcF family protein [Propionibacteriaceae bacterium]|nr:YdcF family protein [Propionibacteriaceae bacterium]
MSDRTAYPRLMAWVEWVWRGVLSVLGLFLAVNGIWLLATANLNTGVLLQLAVAAAMILFGLWRRAARARWLTVPAIAVGILFGLVAGFLAGYGLNDTASDDEDALIVLGAAVHGREVSPSLAQRLEVAVDYHRRNPEALIVVTGGRGPQEDIAEAVAARDFLVARGLPEDALVLEDRSTSTVENFAFAKVLLDERLGDDYRVAFVTNEYHVWRAARLAEGAGLDATHLHSATRWYVWPSSYLRESAAVLWTLVA